MCILSTRKFGQSEAAAFSAALSGNTSLTELLASGHPLDVAGASAFGEALSRNTTLRSLCVGDNDFGDEVRVVSQKEESPGRSGFMWDGIVFSMCLMCATMPLPFELTCRFLFLVQRSNRSDFVSPQDGTAHVVLLAHHAAKRFRLCP